MGANRGDCDEVFEPARMKDGGGAATECRPDDQYDPITHYVGTFARAVSKEKARR